MKIEHAQDLPHMTLTLLVDRLQEHMFLLDEGDVEPASDDVHVDTRGNVWSIDKEIEGSDLVDFVTELLDEHGLAPRGD